MYCQKDRKNQFCISHSFSEIFQVESRIKRNVGSTEIFITQQIINKNYPVLIQKSQN